MKKLMTRNCQVQVKTMAVPVVEMVAQRKPSSNNSFSYLVFSCKNINLFRNRQIFHCVFEALKQKRLVQEATNLGGDFENREINKSWGQIYKNPLRKANFLAEKFIF